MPATALSATVMPGITVNDIDASIKFYVDGLGFEISDKTEAEGKMTYAGLRAGDAYLGVSQDDFAKGRNREKGVGFRLFFGTDQDVAEIADRAKAAGITLDSEPEKMPWGPIGFSLTDPDGFKITVANEA